MARQQDWWYYGGPGHMERDRATLLVLDRAEDPLTPFLHDQHYQVAHHYQHHHQQEEEESDPDGTLCV